MSARIDKNGNRTRPHVCGKNCPQDHTHDWEVTPDGKQEV